MVKQKLKQYEIKTMSVLLQGQELDQVMGGEDKAPRVVIKII